MAKNKQAGWPTANMKPETLVNNVQGYKNLAEADHAENLAAWPNSAGENLNKSRGSIVKSRPV